MSGEVPWVLWQGFPGTGWVMKRIGITAGRIARGNLFLYNFFVCLLSLIFSLLIFFVSAFSLIAGLALVSLVTRGIVVFNPGTGLSSMLFVCLGTLAAVVVLLNLVFIMVNVRLKK